MYCTSDTVVGGPEEDQPCLMPPPDVVNALWLKDPRTRTQRGPEGLSFWAELLGLSRGAIISSNWHCDQTGVNGLLRGRRLPDNQGSVFVELEFSAGTTARRRWPCAAFGLAQHSHWDHSAQFAEPIQQSGTLVVGLPGVSHALPDTVGPTPSVHVLKFIWTMSASHLDSSAQLQMATAA
jgi:hypothetical protein